MRCLLLFLFFALSNAFINAQDCDCLIAEVENNEVTSCNYSVGTEIVVATASEFMDAISQANNSGGNMTILIADGTYQIASTNGHYTRNGNWDLCCRR